MTRFMMMTKTAARIYEQFISSDKCSCHRDFHANANVLPLIESVLAGRLRCMNEEYAIPFQLEQNIRPKKRTAQQMFALGIRGCCDA